MLIRLAFLMRKSQSLRYIILAASQVAACTKAFTRYAEAFRPSRRVFLPHSLASTSLSFLDLLKTSGTEAKMSSSGNLPAFPTDVLSVSLITLSLQKLVDGNAEECRRLFKACTDLGFFYLDLSSAVKGSILLKDVDNLFELASDLSHLSSREKEACRSTHDIFGYGYTLHIYPSIYYTFLLSQTTVD